jgi:hypothetical protein
VPAGLYAPCLMGSKVPGAVVTDPPTAKLPCSWIISSPGEALDGLFLAHLTKPAESALALYQPALYFAVQGGKQVLVGEEALLHKGSRRRYVC